MIMKVRILSACLLAVLMSSARGRCESESFKFPTLTGAPPLLIAHRGASGERPEHTLAAYQLAMEQGADFIEPDLVITKDGVLIARHEPNLLSTTDVAERVEYRERRTSKLVDGVAEEGFFAEDFTLAEIKSLRAVQPRPYRDQSFNGLYEVPTLVEIIELVKSFEKTNGRKIGIYPETKHPSYFRQQGLPLEEALLADLVNHDFTDPDRVYIQSFEVTNLKDQLKPLMESRGLALPLIQLFDELTKQPYDYKLQGRQETYGELLQPESLKNLVATYARGIGPWKVSLFPRVATEAVDINGDGQAEAKERLTGEALPVIQDAHAAGLLVHVYTLRDEERFQAIDFASPEAEYQALAWLGVDGYFSDFPATGRRALLSAKR